MRLANRNSLGGYFESGRKGTKGEGEADPTRTARRVSSTSYRDGATSQTNKWIVT